MHPPPVIIIIAIAAALVGGIALLTGNNPVDVVLGWLGTVIQGLAALADQVVALLPNAADLHITIPSGWIYGYNIINTFLPLSECLAFVAALVTVVIVGMTWSLAVTVYHLIPKPMAGT